MSVLKAEILCITFEFSCVSILNKVSYKKRKSALTYIVLISFLSDIADFHSIIGNFFTKKYAESRICEPHFRKRVRNMLEFSSKWLLEKDISFLTVWNNEALKWDISNCYSKTVLRFSVRCWNDQSCFTDLLWWTYRGTTAMIHTVIDAF